MNDQLPLSVSLSLEELNIIVDSLGKEPYVRVFALINKIQTQAHEQLQALNNHHQEEDKTILNVKPDESQ